MHSWHCTQHTNIIVTSQIIKFNNSFRFSGGHPPSFEYDKKFDSSFMLEIKFIHDTNRINNKFYSFPPGNRHCETSGNLIFVFWATSVILLFCHFSLPARFLFFLPNKFLTKCTIYQQKKPQFSC